MCYACTFSLSFGDSGCSVQDVHIFGTLVYNTNHTCREYSKLMTCIIAWKPLISTIHFWKGYCDYISVKSLNQLVFQFRLHIQNRPTLVSTISKYIGNKQL